VESQKIGGLEPYAFVKLLSGKMNNCGKLLVEFGMVVASPVKNWTILIQINRETVGLPLMVFLL